MSTPHTYENALRAHDEAVWRWVGGLLVDYPPDPLAATPAERKQVPILKVMASPDRAFAQLAETLTREGYFAQDATAADMRARAALVDTVPLPFVSIRAADPVNDPEFAAAAVTERRVLDPATGQWVVHPWPGHYRREYTLTFWAKTVATEAYCREWVMGQLGRRGAGNYETFIPVDHLAPWGTFDQSWKMLDSADQSVYEGGDARYRRFSYTFALRFWVMKAPWSAARIDAAGAAVAVPTSEPGAPLADAGGPAASPAESANLFGLFLPDAKVAALWPRTGAAAVRVGPDRPFDGWHRRSRSLLVTLGSTADSVDVGEYPTDAGGSGQPAEAVYSVAFDVRSPVPLTFEASQRDAAATTRTVCYSCPLPGSRRWVRFHRYVVATRAVVAFTVAGTGTAPATAWLANLTVRRVYPAARVPASALGAAAAAWSGLLPLPYLVVGRLTPGAPAAVTFTLANDAFGGPGAAATRVEAADPSVNAGVALLAHPPASSARLAWAGTTLASAWAQRYDGTYYGSDV